MEIDEGTRGELPGVSLERTLAEIAAPKLAPAKGPSAKAVGGVLTVMLTEAESH